MFTDNETAVYNRSDLELGPVKDVIQANMSVDMAIAKDGQTTTFNFDRALSLDEQSIVNEIIHSFRSGVLPISEHNQVDSIRHSIIENSFTEIIKTAGFTTQVTIWDNPEKNRKIRETIFTRVGAIVTSVLTNQYDDSETITDSYLETIARKPTAISGVLTSV